MSALARRYRIIGADRSGLSFDGDDVIFTDTTGDDLLREGRDLDLSHWYPNCTPAEYRADTSTEIALRFVAANPDHDYLVVNDHADTDGVLAVFVLVWPELALAHREVIRQAAEMGDFSFCGSREASLLYASLTERRLAARAAHSDGQVVFATCLEFLVEYLSGRVESSASAAAAVDALEESVAMVESGRVDRNEAGARLTAYVVPDEVSETHVGLSRGRPGFDVQMTADVWLSHRARNAFDGERYQLLSTPMNGGWHHALWMPQYVPWDTETLWRPPQWNFTGGRLTWRLTSAALRSAVDALTADDRGGAWTLRDEVAPWTEGFPVVVESPVGSGVSPEKLVGTIAPAFA